MRKELNQKPEGLKRPPPPPARPSIRYVNEDKKPSKMQMKERAFKDAIAPYVEQKAKIYSFCTSMSAHIKDDGTVENIYNFNEAQKTNLRLIDELIDSKHREIFNT